MAIKLKQGLLTLAVSVSFFALNEVDAEAASWQARPVEAIQSDMNQLPEGNTTYAIQWGDTLGAIASASGVDVNKLASVNEIENEDLIIVGNELVFSQNKTQVTVEDKATQTETTYDIQDDVTVVEEKPATPDPVAEPEEAVSSEPEQAPEPSQAPVQEEAPARVSGVSGQSVGQFQATAYTAYDGTQIGITRGGTDMANGNIWTASGHRIIAADTSVLPLGTLIQVTTASGQTITGQVDDTGGAINGNIIDIAFASKEEAFSFGRQTVQVSVLN